MARTMSRDVSPSSGWLLDGEADVTRRRLLGGAVGALAAGVLGPLVDWPSGLLGAGLAASDDLVTDTINGFVAFVLPGRDGYSRAQGVMTDTRGGVGAGVTRAMIVVLDFVASDQQGRPVPHSGAVASLLNSAAQQVNPAANRGSFVSPFSRLSFVEKEKAYLSLETNPGLVSGPTHWTADAGGADGLFGGAGLGPPDRKTQSAAGRLAHVRL